ncbi:rSAM-associated Gly-rich repeat protein [Cyanobium sp. FGCU-6]|nr:rSAM-associated Gly-rich repeat protein [Cyanobium sp. FGCU6]
MAFPSRPSLLGLLLLLALPPEGAAALAMLPAPGPTAAAPGLEARLQRIQEAVRDRQPDGAAQTPDSDNQLAFTFVNGPGIGWGNGGFRNGGFANGGFRNGGFYNGGFRNGGFGNGGFRNGGAWRNGGGAGWRNGGFRNSW